MLSSLNKTLSTVLLKRRYSMQEATHDFKKQLEMIESSVLTRLEHLNNQQLECSRQIARTESLFSRKLGDIASSLLYSIPLAAGVAFFLGSIYHVTQPGPIPLEAKSVGEAEKQSTFH